MLCVFASYQIEGFKCYCSGLSTTTRLPVLLLSTSSSGKCKVLLLDFRCYVLCATVRCKFLSARFQMLLVLGSTFDTMSLVLLLKASGNYKLLVATSRCWVVLIVLGATAKCLVLLLVARCY
ncbi:hypothetical protein M0804_013371 [Polistes exclamans]|nr:hypothetical protein M0804_013371 [Polistes exclamans]